MTRLLSKEQILAEMQEFPHWELKKNAICKDLLFKDFGEAIQFINAVSLLAEEHNHHPDMCIRFNRVNISMTTKNPRGISQKDFKLLKKIDHFIKT